MGNIHGKFSLQKIKSACTKCIYREIKQSTQEHKINDITHLTIVQDNHKSALLWPSLFYD